MTINEQKRFVIIENIDSNIIEEAILVLKDENYVDTDSNIKEKRNFIIMDEAYSIINNYENLKHDTQKTADKQQKSSTSLGKVWSKIFNPFSIFLIASAIYLIYKIT